MRLCKENLGIEHIPAKLTKPFNGNDSSLILNFRKMKEIKYV